MCGATPSCWRGCVSVVAMVVGMRREPGGRPVRFSSGFVLAPGGLAGRSRLPARLDGPSAVAGNPKPGQSNTLRLSHQHAQGAEEEVGRRRAKRARPTRCRPMRSSWAYLRARKNTHAATPASPRPNDTAAPHAACSRARTVVTRVHGACGSEGSARQAAWSIARRPAPAVEPSAWRSTRRPSSRHSSTT